MEFYDDREMWQRTEVRPGSATPLRDQEATLVLAACERIKASLKLAAKYNNQTFADPMLLAQKAVRAVFAIVEPAPETKPWVCPDGVEDCTYIGACQHEWQTPQARESLRKVMEEIDEERAVLGDRALGVVTPEKLARRQAMWVGGSRTWYSPWHGEADG